MFFFPNSFFILVDLLWTYFSSSVAFLNCSAQNQMQHSTCGLAKAKEKRMMTSLDFDTILLLAMVFCFIILLTHVLFVIHSDLFQTPGMVFYVLYPCLWFFLTKRNCICPCWNLSCWLLPIVLVNLVNCQLPIFLDFYTLQCFPIPPWLSSITIYNADPTCL